MKGLGFLKMQKVHKLYMLVLTYQINCVPTLDANNNRNTPRDPAQTNLMKKSPPQARRNSGWFFGQNAFCVFSNSEQSYLGFVFD
jgi:hypothetical protein